MTAPGYGVRTAAADGVVGGERGGPSLGDRGASFSGCGQPLRVQVRPSPATVLHSIGRTVARSLLRSSWAWFLCCSCGLLCGWQLHWVPADAQSRRRSQHSGRGCCRVHRAALGQGWLRMVSVAASWAGLGCHAGSLPCRCSGHHGGLCTVSVCCCAAAPGWGLMRAARHSCVRCRVWMDMCSIGAAKPAHQASLTACQNHVPGVAPTVHVPATWCNPSTRADRTALLRLDTSQGPADRDSIPCCESGTSAARLPCIAAK